MLVLSRKLNETILIGDKVRVTLLGIDGDKIKIGIDAPREVRVYREELLEATKDMNKQALAAPNISFESAKNHKRTEHRGNTKRIDRQNNPRVSEDKKKDE